MQKYYGIVSYDNNILKQVPCYIINIHGLRCFWYKGINTYYIIEPRTGRDFGRGKTLTVAKEKAKERRMNTSISEWTAAVRDRSHPAGNLNPWIGEKVC